MKVTLGEILVCKTSNQEYIVVRVETNTRTGLFAPATPVTLVTLLNNGHRTVGPEDSIDKYFHRRKAKFMKIV